MVSRPHGNKLVNRVASEKVRERILSNTKDFIKLSINLSMASDIENIAYGAYSPLEGFLDSEDYEYVLNSMRLSNDIPWTIPIILDIDMKLRSQISVGDELLLYYNDIPVALLEVSDMYKWDKWEYAEKVYSTRDTKHPGVSRTLSRNDLLIGGKVLLLNSVPSEFDRYLLRPIETRVLFREKGWKTIVGFQTRNVPHLGHEYIQKAALTFADGLFINPLIGWKKVGDFRDEVIISAYEALIENYFPKDSVVFAILRMEMRYAGPREAIHHAIVRKNYGCTHFIVGRDHAGVGNYYPPYAAWEIFDEFPDLGITPLFIRESFYCRKCSGMVNEKICPHSESDKIKISGTMIRQMLLEGRYPPEYMMRREVARAILKFENPFIR